MIPVNEQRAVAYRRGAGVRICVGKREGICPVVSQTTGNGVAGIVIGYDPTYGRGAAATKCHGAASCVVTRQENAPGEGRIASIVNRNVSACPAGVGNSAIKDDIIRAADRRRSDREIYRIVNRPRSPSRLNRSGRIKGKSRASERAIVADL